MSRWLKILLCSQVELAPHLMFSRGLATLHFSYLANFHFGISEENLSAEPGKDNEDKRTNLGQKTITVLKKKNRKKERASDTSRAEVASFCSEEDKTGGLKVFRLRAGAEREVAVWTVGSVCVSGGRRWGVLGKGCSCNLQN